MELKLKTFFCMKCLLRYFFLPMIEFNCLLIILLEEKTGDSISELKWNKRNLMQFSKTKLESNLAF